MLPRADAPPDYDRGIELLREALAEGRRLISGLRPPILDERGVVAALEYLVTEVRPEIPQIEFVNNTQFGRLTPAIEVAIFRIAQEAITNVRLHSGAQRASVNSSSTANGSVWSCAIGAAASIPPPFRRNASDSKVFANAPDSRGLRPSSKAHPARVQCSRSTFRSFISSRCRPAVTHRLPKPKAAEIPSSSEGELGNKNLGWRTFCAAGRIERGR